MGYESRCKRPINPTKPCELGVKDEWKIGQDTGGDEGYMEALNMHSSVTRVQEKLNATEGPLNLTYRHKM